MRVILNLDEKLILKYAKTLGYDEIDLLNIFDNEDFLATLSSILEDTIEDFL